MEGKIHSIIREQYKTVYNKVLNEIQLSTFSINNYKLQEVKGGKIDVGFQYNEACQLIEDGIQKISNSVMGSIIGYFPVDFFSSNFPI